MAPPTLLLLGLAGIVGGAVGTAGGITSLISYPALLAAGITPVAASIANIVAYVGCLPGSVIASGPELHGRGRELLRMVPLATAGAAIGAALLLHTPGPLLARAAPMLLLAAAMALALQPHLSRQTPRAALSQRRRAGGTTLLCLYNAYFGAGSGIMLLALLLWCGETSVTIANATKNVLLGAASIISASVFVAAGAVDWTATIPLAAGMFLGSLLGPAIARVAPPRLIRGAAAASGVLMAAHLLLSPV